ncbi:TlpA family protein disulfide reductase [Sphingobacterium arenae]|uniref:TlpA family protein disulfide reductase n=1 Tax=Sphingobacterium arenae TaxID=1280598 RepID=A0ABR7Y3B4_9SPHI|nr:TlpA disulfide reductase family protein [Sphingobacterium arenae]MBD1425771.1 TlpA family protein disulfide reductase [Sphingobacterium arenae]
MTTDINTDTTTIVAGASKITGRIITPDGHNKDNINVTITVLHPISGENVRHKVVADQSGKFSLDFDVETETSSLGLYTSVSPYKTLIITPTTNDSTHIDITYDSDFNIKNVDVTPAMNKYDMRQSMEVLNKMINYRPNKPPGWVYPRLYDKTTDEFLDKVRSTVSERLALFVDNDKIFSKEFKGIIAKDYRLFLYTGHVFDYEAEMKRNYRNATQDRVGMPEIQSIDRSYFRFLKDFKLNDPQYLHTFTFPEFQNLILQNEVLGLPTIGESDISSWLATVKAILADLVGFDEGPYYDILAANAYAHQLNEEIKPLTDKQKEHIEQYWKNGEIAKILFRKNQQIIELDKVKSPLVVNDISSVPEDKVMETIVSKYKDKVVFIDLWATWCAPCLEAIKQFRGTKGDFRDKDVVFVYLTNGSSPQKLWEEKIKGIGDEHYYLTDAQWGYMMDYFEFQYIPSYLLYNKEGLLVNKFSEFPGNDVVKEMIDVQLK